MKLGVPISERAPRRPGVFGALSVANTNLRLRRITRQLGALAPVVQMANTRRSFRGEGWGEGRTLSPLRHSLFPSPSPCPRTTLPNQPGSLAKEITRLPTCTPPNTPGLRPGPLAPVVRRANTRRFFRVEGWGEGRTPSLLRSSQFPSPSLSPHQVVDSGELHSGERDQASGRFPRTNLPNQPGSLAKEITLLTTCTAPNTPGLRPDRLRHSSF